MLFAVYTVFVAKFAPIWWVNTQSHLQANLSMAQNFIYNDSDTIKNIIVGTSLAANIITDSLTNTYNLSFAGRNAIDGLKILNEKTKIPKNIFIEINYVQKGASAEFTSLINNPIMHYPRKELLSLREDRQPMAILGLIQFNELIRLKNIIINKPKDKKAPQVNEKKDDTSPVFYKFLAVQIKDYSIIPKNRDLKKVFKAFKHYVVSLEKKGANITFFEMPVNRQLEGLPRAKLIRNFIKLNFPSSKYTFIAPPDSIAFHTTDGIHLGKHEALQYTLYLKSKSKNLQ